MINAFKSHQVSDVNGLKTVVANEGDTYEIIAQEMGLKEWELYKFNDQPRGYRPQPNEIVYVQSKNRKTGKQVKTHRVHANETMHYISQVYGVQLKPLLKRNNMKRGDEPEIGQIIYLHKKAK